MSANIVATVGSNSKGTIFTPADGSKYLLADRSLKHDFKVDEKVVILDLKEVSGLRFATKVVRFVEKQAKAVKPEQPKIVVPKPVIMPVNPVEEALAQSMEDCRKVADAVSHAKNILKIAMQAKTEQERINTGILKKAAEFFGDDSPAYGNMMRLCEEAIDKIGVEEKQHDYLMAIDQAVIATQLFGIKPFLGRSDKLDAILVPSVPLLTPETTSTVSSEVTPEPKIRVLTKAEETKKRKLEERQAAHERAEAKKAKAKQEYEDRLAAEADEAQRLQDLADIAQAKKDKRNADRRAARKAKKAPVVLES